MSDRSQSQSQSNKSGDPASRFLVGILGTLFALLAICTVVLIKPHFVRAIRRLETAHQQRVAVDRTIEKRRLARKPRLGDCWIDGKGLEENNRLHGNYGTRWADLQPLGAELEHTPPPAYTRVVASGTAVPVAIPPLRPPRTELARPCPVQLPHQPHQRPWAPNPDVLVQLTVFVAMPTPSRPLYAPPSRPSPRYLASTSTSPSPSRTYHDHPSPGTLISPYTHQSSITSINIHQGLTLGVTVTPFIPNHLPSPPSSASEAQKQP